MKSLNSARLILTFGTLALGSVLAQDAPPAPPAPPGALPGGASAADAAADAAAFQTPEEQRNYALGFFLANQLKRQGDADKTNLDEVEAGLKSGLSGTTTADFVSGASLATMLKRDELKVDAAQLMAALRDAMAGKKSKLSESGLRNEMQVVQQEAMQRRQEKTKLEAEANLKEANDFLEKNAKAEGVTTTPSGLQYKKLSDGKGEKANPEEMVLVNFVGTLAGGKEFDRTPDGQPRAMPQSQPNGWQEAMQIMDIGSKYTFWLPPALAYGETGRLPAVRPNAVVIYEVELVGTQPAPPPRTLNPGAATPPIAVPGPKRVPISATTPPVSIDIPEKAPADKPKQKK